MCVRGGDAGVWRGCGCVEGMRVCGGTYACCTYFYMLHPTMRRFAAMCLDALVGPAGTSSPNPNPNLNNNNNNNNSNNPNKSPNPDPN